MAPSDALENADRQGEAQEMPATAKDDGGTQVTPSIGPKTFPRFTDFPLEIRRKIRTEAIQPAKPEYGVRPPLEQRCFPLAVVCKEWREDVEKVLFSEIAIDSLDEQEVSMFKERFSTDRRRRFLTRLDIATEDTPGVWNEEGGFAPIAYLMSQIGKFLQYINTWDIRREDASNQAIEIIVQPTLGAINRRFSLDVMLGLYTPCVWRKNNVDFLTRNGEVSVDLPLEAVKSNFPCSLNIAKRLAFAPDFVPLPAARAIIQTMPNLQACHLEPRIDIRNEKSWTNLISLIHQLRTSAPSLRHLTLGTSMDLPPMDHWSDGMIDFAVTLRQYSQRLESLRAPLLPLDREFFLPWSLRMREVDPLVTIMTPRWAWLSLKRLDLLFLDDEDIRVKEEGNSIGFEDDVESTASDVDSIYSVKSLVDDEAASVDLSTSGLGPYWKRDLSDPKRDVLQSSPADTLSSAGRAVTSMPLLRTVRIAVTSGHAIFVKRKLQKWGWGAGPIVSRFYLKGCSENEQRDILEQWDLHLGDRTWDPALEREFCRSLPPGFLQYKYDFGKARRDNDDTDE